MAIDIPKGRAIRMAINVIRKVPDNKGRMPKCASSNSGVHWVSVRNSQMDTFEKKPMESFSKTKRIPRVVTTLTVAQSNKSTSMTRSLIILFLRLISHLLLIVEINRRRHCSVPPSRILFGGFQIVGGPVDRFLLKGVHSLLLLLNLRFR